MDVVTYALLKKKIDNVTLAYTYKGSVNTVEDLPVNADTGDLYTIDGIQYVYDGTAWINVNPAITQEQIDALEI